jgi:hypothetical protein
VCCRLLKSLSHFTQWTSGDSPRLFSPPFDRLGPKGVPKAYLFPFSPVFLPLSSIHKTSPPPSALLSTSTAMPSPSISLQTHHPTHASHSIFLSSPLSSTGSKHTQNSPNHTTSVLHQRVLLPRPRRPIHDTQHSHPRPSLLKLVIHPPLHTVVHHAFPFHPSSLRNLQTSHKHRKILSRRTSLFNSHFGVLDFQLRLCVSLNVNSHNFTV